MRDQSRTLKVSSAAQPELAHPALVPVRLSGEEGLDGLFEYRLDLKTGETGAPGPAFGDPAGPGANLELSSLVGSELTVRIELDGKGAPGSGSAGSRELSGLVMEASYVAPEGRHHRYRLVLRPWLWLATQTSDCRIFQDQSVIGVLETLLADYPYPADFRLDKSRYPLRDYTVQFNETDYAFFARLCAEWGIAWWFEHSEGKHRLILADTLGAFAPNPHDAYQQLNWYPPGHRIDEEHLDTLAIHDRLTPGATASTDTDYTRARADLSVAYHDPRPTASADQEVFRWPLDTAQPKAGAGGYPGPGNDPWAEGDELNRRRLEALRAPGRRAIGHGNLRAMVPGSTFSLTRHPQEAANQDWLILSVKLLIEEVAEETQSPSALGVLVRPIQRAIQRPIQEWRCEADFTLQPADQPYRPEQRFTRPTAQAHRATVTGPAGKEIWTDALGRVKVAFPWDRRHPNDEHSSAWLRASSPWAGSQYGAIQIPRIGQEVLVDYEAGDPDRPLIVGRLINDTQLPPWELPGNQALSGFRSKELYGQQANQLVLDDSEGAVQAQFSSDHAFSQLNLGKIVRIPDERGRQDKRGEGFELRTDAHGVIRAQDGLLLTTEGRGRGRATGYVKAMDETLDRLANAQEHHEQLADLARRHAAHEEQSGEVAKSLHEQNDALKGSGSADVEAGRFPEFAAPHLTLASPAGIEATTSGSLHLAADKHIALTVGQHLSLAAQTLVASLHNGIRLFSHKLGIKLVAAANDIEIKAFKHNVKMAAALKIEHTAERITLSAEKQVTFNGGGSFAKWTSDGILYGTAGRYQVHSATRAESGPKSLPPLVQKFPAAEAYDEQFRALVARSGEPFVALPYRIETSSGQILEGLTDRYGLTPRVCGDSPKGLDTTWGGLADEGLIEDSRDEAEAGC